VAHGCMNCCDGVSQWMRYKNNWALVRSLLARRRKAAGLDKALTDVVTFEEWVSRFPGGSRRNKRVARLNPLEPHDARRVTAMRKRENLLKAGTMIDCDTEDESGTSFALFDPRIICVYPDWLHTVVGPATWSLSKLLKEKARTMPPPGGLYNTDGMDAMELGRLYSDLIDQYLVTGSPSGGFVAWLDVSRADASHRREAGEAFAEHVEAMDNTLVGIGAYVRSTFVKPVVSRAGVTARTSYRNGSGIDWTSIANAEMIGASLVACAPPGSIVVNRGDDAFVVAHMPCFERLQAKMSGLGWNITGSESCDPLKSDFLSGRFWRVIDASGKPVWQYVPRMGRMLAKSFFRLQNDEKSDIRWVRGVAMGLLRDYAAMPIARAILNRLVVLTTNVEALQSANKDFKHKPHSDETCTASDETYVQFYAVYKIMKYEIEVVEQEIGAWTTVQQDLCGSVFARIFAADCA